MSHCDGRLYAAPSFALPDRDSWREVLGRVVDWFLVDAAGAEVQSRKDERD